MAVSSMKQRGRPYSVMLLLAFTAAMGGVMMLNKVREIRVHNMFIAEKDREIMALNTKFRRAKGHKEEMRGKLENMRAKIQSLKNTNAELNKKLMQVQSLTASLREKYRSLGADLEEKQIQIENLNEKQKLSEKIYVQLGALREALKQKEDEIRELKRQQENQSTTKTLVSDVTSSFPTTSTVIKSAVDIAKNTEEQGTVYQRVNEDIVKKEQGQQYLTSENIKKQREEETVLAGKQQEQLHDVNELPENGTQQIVIRTGTAGDENFAATGKLAKKKKLQLLENSKSSNADRRQGQTVVLVTNLDEIHGTVIRAQGESSRDANVKQHEQTLAEDDETANRVGLQENVKESTVEL